MLSSFLFAGNGTFLLKKYDCNAISRTCLYSNTYFSYEIKPIWVSAEPVTKFVSLSVSILSVNLCETVGQEWIVEIGLLAKQWLEERK